MTTPPTIADMPGRLGVANIALALGLSVPSLAYLAVSLSTLLVDAPVLQKIAAGPGNFSGVMYLVSPLAIYVLIRVLGIDARLHATRPMQVMIGIGSALLIVYVAALVLATALGGAVSILLGVFSGLAIYPARVFHLLGLGWLIVCSVRMRGQSRESPPFTLYEATLVVAALAVPAVFGSILYILPGSPLRMAGKAREFMEARCPSAGEKILRQPAAPVAGLYVDYDGGDHFSFMKNGIYESGSNGVFAISLLQDGRLRIMEEDNRFARREERGEFKYRRYVTADDWKGTPVNELESEYGLMHKDLTTDVEKRAGIVGYEVAIRDLQTGEIMATTTYFVDPSHRRFCGHVTQGSFNLFSFAQRALNLTRRYPPRTPDPPVSERKPADQGR